MPNVERRVLHAVALRVGDDHLRVLHRQQREAQRALKLAHVFPTIDFNTHSAAPGDTLTLTGVNFPTNSVVDVYLTPLLSLNAYTPIAQTTTSDTGTISFALAIPTTLNGVALQGNAFSVLVKTRTTGYYGFNFFYNSRGF